MALLERTVEPRFPHCCWLVWTGTGIAAVDGLSNLTRADTVFIQKQEKITKSFLASTTAVNGICTRSYHKQSAPSPSAPRARR